MTTEKPKRRWYQFSLRTLLMFVLLFSIGMSWFAVKLQQARRQREAVETLRELGAEVLYDYEAFAWEVGMSPKPPQPAWLRELLGIDCFADVTSVRWIEYFRQLRHQPAVGPDHFATDAGRKPDCRPSK